MALDVVDLELSSACIERIMRLADEREVIESRYDHDHPLWLHSPYGCEALISSHGASGWMISLLAWQRRVWAQPDDLKRLCSMLCSTGRTADRLAAGRVRAAVAAWSKSHSWPARPAIDTSSWEGEDAPKKPSVPKGRRAVAEAWKAGKALDGGNIRTDGKTVWSWSLRIGVTVRGRKIALDHRGVSQSTSTHCGEVMRVADVVKDAAS